MRQLIKKSFLLSCIYYLFTDFLMRIKYQLGIIHTDSGTIHSGISTKDSIKYISDVFNDYKQYGDIDFFKGRIAEIGPGDNCGVGLLFLNDGSASVDLVDRFYSHRNSKAQAIVYESLIEQFPNLKNFLQGADLKDEKSFGRLQRHYGPSASAEEFFKYNIGYDFIVSRAVFEHLYDPILALKIMNNSLNLNGYLLHKVDLRDHGLFSDNFHELKFLEVPNFFYKFMTEASGRPNRVLVHEYRKALLDSGLKFKILVTRLAGVGDINPHSLYSEIPEEMRRKSIEYIVRTRHKFSNKFKNVSNEDLSVAGIFIVAKKNQI